MKVQGAAEARRSDWERKILPLRRQAEITNGWLRYRLENVLPAFMEEEGFDMWIVAGREYNEDPVILTMLPATTLQARRRTVLVFYRRADGTLERLVLVRVGDSIKDFYECGWLSHDEEQWEAVGRIVRERDPKCIGINISQNFAFGDGLSHTEYEALMESLGPDYRAKTKSAERLCLRWLEHRTQSEIDAYTGIVQIAHGIIEEGFSSRVIHPGVTTCADVSWWMRQRIVDLGLYAWFHPSVDAQRSGSGRVHPNEPILPGDLLHCDVGIKYLGLCTDTQQLAYVLKLDEEDAPKGLKHALAVGNRLQDILAEEHVTGKTGNQMLASALARAKAEGIRPCIYQHAVGYHGHAAGTIIGYFDFQEGLPGKGDYELHENTVHAMELNVVESVPEWGGQDVLIALEQTTLFKDKKVHFLAGRQTDFHLIK
ncbi:MAG: M24 family metallopeptidase [Bacillota bacterium]|jgi:Xaa-Pro aminopeptidase